MTTSDQQNQDSDSCEFTIKSNDEFNSKKDSVFGSLAVIEQKHVAYEKVRSKADDVIKSDPVEDRLIDDRRGRRGQGQGQSRRGRGVANRGHNGRFGRQNAPYLPSYRREPKNWTMYDLSDVDNSQMSEKSTKAAAMDFLKDLKKRKLSEDKIENANLDDKVVFKKPKIIDASQEKSDSNASGSSGKVIMPEFNFGVKKDRAKKEARKPGSVDRGKGVCLSHLDDDDDDDDDEADCDD